MMTTENIYKEPSPPEKPKRHRRTKAQMTLREAVNGMEQDAALHRNLSGESIARDTVTGCKDPSLSVSNGAAQPFIHAQAAADWLCTNLLENSPGWQIGDALRRSLEAQP